MIVFIPKYGIEGTVVLVPKAADSENTIVKSDTSFVLDEEKQTVSLRNGTRAYTVFDKVAVRISIIVGAAHRRQLSLEWVDRDQLPLSELMT